MEAEAQGGPASRRCCEHCRSDTADAARGLRRFGSMSVAESERAEMADLVRWGVPFVIENAT
eukprot:7190806-Prymnesium_polylepis.1